jgi:hypothetical protein
VIVRKSEFIFVFNVSQSREEHRQKFLVAENEEKKPLEATSLKLGNTIKIA